MAGANVSPFTAVYSVPRVCHVCKISPVIPSQLCPAERWTVNDTRHGRPDILSERETFGATKENRGRHDLFVFNSNFIAAKSLEMSRV